MTLKRKKWWDSLPANEMELRVALDSSRKILSLLKRYLTESKGNVCLVKQVRRQKLIIKAIKHELDRATTMVYTGIYRGVSPIYRCEKCDGIVECAGQWRCPCCGRKINKWIESYLGWASKCL